jgi:chloride channel protein, CIC family
MVWGAMDVKTTASTLTRWSGLDRAEGVLRRLGFNDYTLLLLLAGLVGALTGLGVVAFRTAFSSLTSWLLPGADGHDVTHVLRATPSWKIVTIPAVGGLVVGLIHRYGLRGADFHGVAAVINSVAFLEGRIPILFTAVRFFTNALSIAFGASVGPEGPVIELGSGLGSGLGQWLRLSPERVRTLVGCGAAAGLSAAFNAPIAGALFALEVVLKDFAVVTFSPIIVSAVLATAVSRSILGNTSAFEVPDYSLGSPLELGLYLLLGVFAGMLGWAFTRSLHWGEGFFARMPGPRPLHTALAGAVLGGAISVLPELYGVGYEPVTELLRGGVVWKSMLVLMVAKFVATNLSLSGGFAGGIFAPILLTGGAMGGVFGQFATQIFPASTSSPASYSLVGMAALMAAVTHAPITSILILFEMTGGYAVILPLMIACISAVAIAQAFSTDSTFTLGFHAKGLEVNYGRESAILRSYYVEDLMHAEVASLRADTRFGDVLDRFLEHQEDQYYVMDHDGVLVGFIDIHSLKGVLAEKGLRWVVLAADLMQPVRYVLARRENLEEAISLLTSSDEEVLPVVDSHQEKRLVGSISRGDILELYNREILHREVLGIKLVHADTHAADYVDLPAEYEVTVLPVGSQLAGRTLAELDLRGRFGVNVLAVKRPGRKLAGRNELPDPQTPLRGRDRLVVVGERDAVGRLRDETGG